MSSALIKPDIIARLESVKPRLAMRSGLVAAIRSYFQGNGFLEVDTPLVIDAPAPEEYIEAPTGGGGFLRTSPELQMKCMLAAGYDKIFQLGPCFRKNEFGRQHRPEFTMLEWYESGVDYMRLAEFTESMLRAVCQNLTGGTTVTFREQEIDFSKKWNYITVAEAFLSYAGVDMNQALADDSFDELMVVKIEPELGKSVPTFLMDYPSERAALSRRKASEPAVSERWELYIAGLELANAFSELTDLPEQRSRFEHSRRERAATGYTDYPWPVDFFAALDYGMPESAGCALGVDRLAMVFTGAEDIAEVTFPASERLN